MERWLRRKDGTLRSAEERHAMDRAFAEAIGDLVVEGRYVLVAVDPDRPEPLELPADADIDSVVAAVLTVGRERKAMLERLRFALAKGQDGEALALARELCNLPKGASHGGKTAVH